MALGPTVVSMRTPLTELLEIEHPVMLAGMGGVSYHELVIAVSEAGGFGCMGASTMSPERMDSEMDLVRNATQKPWGVDLLTALPEHIEKQVESLIRHGARVYQPVLHAGRRHRSAHPTRSSLRIRWGGGPGGAVHGPLPPSPGGLRGST